MHFDILVDAEMKDENTIFGYGKEYLKSKNQEFENFGSKESNFCHIEEAKPEVEQSIREKGYYIVEMENCC